MNEPCGQSLLTGSSVTMGALILLFVGAMVRESQKKKQKATVVAGNVMTPLQREKASRLKKIEEFEAQRYSQTPVASKTIPFVTRPSVSRIRCVGCESLNLVFTTVKFRVFTAVLPNFSQIL